VSSVDGDAYTQSENVIRASSETCGSVPADRQRFWLPPGNRGNITLQDNSTGAVFCIDFGDAVNSFPPPSGAPILFAPCEAGRRRQQDILAQLFIDPALSLEQEFFRFVNWASALFVNVVEDAQAGTGYRVETLFSISDFLLSEVSTAHHRGVNGVADRGVTSTLSIPRHRENRIPIRRPGTTEGMTRGEKAKERARTISRGRKAASHGWATARCACKPSRVSRAVPEPWECELHCTNML
jgi:hypothetical protein